MDRFTKNIFPKNLKIARTELGLTQKELSSVLGMSPSVVSGWESGNFFPTGKVLDKMVEMLRIRREFLERGEGDVLSQA